MKAPPTLGNTNNPNEVPLANLLPSLMSSAGSVSAPGVSSQVIDAHLAVQGTIRSGFTLLSLVNLCVFQHYKLMLLNLHSLNTYKFMVPERLLLLPLYTFLFLHSKHS